MKNLVEAARAILAEYQNLQETTGWNLPEGEPAGAWVTGRLGKPIENLARALEDRQADCQLRVRARQSATAKPGTEGTLKGAYEHGGFVYYYVHWDGWKWNPDMPKAERCQDVELLPFGVCMGCRWTFPLEASGYCAECDIERKRNGGAA